MSTRKTFDGLHSRLTEDLDLTEKKTSYAIDLPDIASVLISVAFSGPDSADGDS